IVVPDRPHAERDVAPRTAFIEKSPRSRSVEMELVPTLAPGDGVRVAGHVPAAHGICGADVALVERLTHEVVEVVGDQRRPAGAALVARAEALLRLGEF